MKVVFRASLNTLGAPSTLNESSLLLLFSRSYQTFPTDTLPSFWVVIVFVSAVHLLGVE